MRPLTARCRALRHQPKHLLPVLRCTCNSPKHVKNSCHPLGTTSSSPAARPGRPGSGPKKGWVGILVRSFHLA